MIFEKLFDPIVSGHLIVKLAETEAEVYAAQRLRYRIFCEEMGAGANQAVQAQKRDFDQFDDYCNHVLVIDDTKLGDHRVVGTYRLLTRSNMQKKLGQFYTETEYDVSRIKEQSGEIMELGRSCVEQPYRTRNVIQLLWAGIGSFLSAKDIKIMFGCASFHGVNIAEHKHALSYLYHYHMAPEHIRPRALPEQYVEMGLMPKEDVVPKAAIMNMPPLIKAYLRIGGHIGDGAVLDYAFNTTDVSIVVETGAVKDRYKERYVPDAP